MIEIGKLHHVSICVADLEASRHFYSDVLGMDEVERPPTFLFQGQWFRKNGYEIHTIFIDAAGQVPGDAENIIKPGRDITFARHFCFSVSSVEETVKTLTKENESLKSSHRNEWFMIGALVLFVGLVFGLIMGRQQRKRKSSYY